MSRNHLTVLSVLMTCLLGCGSQTRLQLHSPATTDIPTSLSRLEHIAPRVVPPGAVPLRISVWAGESWPPNLDWIRVAVRLGEHLQYVGAEIDAQLGTATATVSVGQRAIDYRFELGLTDGSVYYFPSDQSFLELSTTASAATFSLPQNLVSLRPLRTRVFNLGDGLNDLGHRTPISTESLHIGPGPIAILDDGTAAIADIFNSRLVLVNAAGEVMFQPLPDSVRSLEQVDGLVLRSDGSGVLTSSVLVFTFGASERTHDLRGWETGDPPLTQLEIFGEVVVAESWSGRYVAIAALDEQQSISIPPDFRSSIATVTHLNDRGIQIAAHHQAVDILPIDDSELIPWPTGRRVTSDGDITLALTKFGTDETIVFTLRDSGGLFRRLVDEHGHPLVLSYGIEGTPALAISASGGFLAALNCDDDTCALNVYQASDATSQETR